MTPLTTPGEGGGGVLLVIIHGGVPPGSSNPDLTTDRQSLYPFSDQNGAKILPDGAAHTYIAYTREYPTQVTTSIFHFHKVISALPTPLTNPTPS